MYPPAPHGATCDVKFYVRFCIEISLFFTHFVFLFRPFRRMPFAVRSFYKTRVTNQGVVNERTRNAVFVPDAEHSDTEDLVDDDKDVQ